MDKILKLLISFFLFTFSSIALSQNIYLISTGNDISYCSVNYGSPSHLGSYAVNPSAYPAELNGVRAWQRLCYDQNNNSISGSDFYVARELNSSGYYCPTNWEPDSYGQCHPSETEPTPEEQCSIDGKYWYNDTCNDDPETTPQEQCTIDGKYWYNNTCNTNPQSQPIQTGTISGCGLPSVP